MIQRRLLIPTFLCAGLLTGCGGSTGNDDSSGGDDGFMTNVPTASADGTAGDGDSDTSDSAATDTTQGDSNATSGDGDDDGSCMSDDDCADGEICHPETMMCQPDCGTAEVVLEAPPPVVMLVLDKSGSMVNNSWDHDGDPGTAEETRWATLYSVADFILTNFENTISFGLQMFPSTSATTSCANDSSCPACDVAGTPEVPLAIENRAAILAAMPAMSADMTSVAGATPAAGGMVNAKTALDAAVASGEIGPAIILITDGAANCGLQWANEPCEFPGDGTSASCELMDYFDDELEPLVQSYNDAGIPTYVVGIDIADQVLDPDSDYNFSVDNTNVYEELNSIAVAGGVPQTGGNESFYNATNEAELQTALSEIAGQIAECDIDLSEDPNTPPLKNQIPYVEFQMMNMTVPGPLDITQEECEMGTEDGWIWIEEGITVLFCGSYCDSLKSTGEVDGIYGCPPIG